MIYCLSEGFAGQIHSRAVSKRIDAVERENRLPEAENERLKLEPAAAKKNPRNSSKPPSSEKHIDILAKN